MLRFSDMTTNLSIYGIGNFGYALLKHLDNKQSDNLSLRAYDRKPDLIKELAKNRRHLYLHRSVNISKNVDFVESPSALLDNCDILVLAVTSDSIREVIDEIKPCVKKELVIINTAKALDRTTAQRASEIVSERLRDKQHSYGLLAGGTIAKDLFSSEPLGADLACSDELALAKVFNILSSDNLSIYPTTDLLGVEYASAFKNIISILAGITNGLGFSYGSETHIISRTAQLVANVSVAEFGAKPETFSIGSQCWGNDLWMSCTGDTRNREFGVLLGKGLTAKTALQQMANQNKSVEGVNTLQVLDKISPLLEIKAINLLYNLVVTSSVSIADFRQYLLGRSGGQK